MATAQLVGGVLLPVSGHLGFVFGIGILVRIVLGMRILVYKQIIQ